MGTFWIDVASGERRDPLARLAAALLVPASALYRLGLYWRNRRYDSDPGSVHVVARPVISVGNLTVGGTGKTPFVEWIAGELQKLDRKPVVLSRGYGGNGANEEAQLLAENCPGVPLVCRADRVAGAMEAINVHQADCIVLDDGFQHRRLHRALDIVLVDATRPFGRRRWLLPAGILREPLSALSRAGAVVVTRSDQAPPAELADLLGELSRCAPRATIAQAVHRPVAWRDQQGGCYEPSWIDGAYVLAVSGLGNPMAFEKTIAALDARVMGTIRFDDHHRYVADDVQRIAAHATWLGAKHVVTTQKDAIKLRDLWPQQPPLMWLRVQIEIVSGRDELRRLVRQTVRWEPA